MLCFSPKLEAQFGAANRSMPTIVAVGSRATSQGIGVANTVLGPENCPWAADSLIVPALISIIFSLAGQWASQAGGAQ